MHPFTFDTFMKLIENKREGLCKRKKIENKIGKCKYYSIFFFLFITNCIYFFHFLQPQIQIQFKQHKI